MNIRRTGWSCAAGAAHSTNTTCTKEIVYFNPGNFSRVITSFSYVCLQRIYATIQFNKIDNSALSASLVASPSPLCRAVSDDDIHRQSNPNYCTYTNKQKKKCVRVRSFLPFTFVCAGSRNALHCAVHVVQHLYCAS